MADRGPQVERTRPQQAEKQRAACSRPPSTMPGPAPSAKRSHDTPTQRPERQGRLRASSGPEVAGARPDCGAGPRRSPFEAAVDRCACAYQLIDQHRRDGLPVLDMQRQEIHAAGQQLDQPRPVLRDLMRSALQHDPQTARPCRSIPAAIASANSPPAWIASGRRFQT